MTTGVGISVGSANVVAAFEDAASGQPSIISRPAVLNVKGKTPELVAAGTVGSVDGFVGRVGDPVGILAANGKSYIGDDLTAAAIAGLLTAVREQVGGKLAVAAAYPAYWSAHAVESLRLALERLDAGDVAPVSTPSAVMRWLQDQSPVDGKAVVVADLGASALDVSVVSTGEKSAVLGTPIHNTDVSGDALDRLTTQHLLASVNAHDLDFFDPAVESAVAALRVNASAAKQALSTDTATSVTVPLPSGIREARIVRSEFEQLASPLLIEATVLIREAITAAGLSTADVATVALVGGGASIPLLSEMIASELGLPVTTAPNPSFIAATGASMLANDIAASAMTVLPPSVSRASAAPVALASSSEAMATGRKVAIVGAAAAAISLLTVTGLSMGTGVPSAFSKYNPFTATPAATAPANPLSTLKDSAAGTFGSPVNPAAAAAKTANGAAKPAAAATKNGGPQSVAGQRVAPIAPPPVRIAEPVRVAPPVYNPPAPVYTPPSGGGTVSEAVGEVIDRAPQQTLSDATNSIANQTAPITNVVPEVTNSVPQVLDVPSYVAPSYSVPSVPIMPSVPIVGGLFG